MKKTHLLPVVGLVAGLLLVGCGGGTSSSKGGKSSSSHVHTYADVWSTDEKGHWHAATCEHTDKKKDYAAHDYEDDPANPGQAATEEAEGWKGVKCKTCGYTARETLPKLLGAVEGTDPATGARMITIDALKGEMHGTNKDSTGATLKFSSNGEYAEYTFNVKTALTGKVYLYGWVDYFKDGNNNNDQRGFFSRKSGEGANFELAINGTAVEITNHSTYEEMGMASKDDGTTDSTFAQCEVGEATLVAGSNTLRYTRVESYNLNITEFRFIANA